MTGPMDYVSTPYLDVGAVFTNPPPPEWECEIMGGQITIRIQPGKVPNRFHRAMYSLVFGAKWRKL